ncbi:MAG TPA: hypothetical protein VMS64_15110 [Candidatus Methylomirabilis sp.]|nr:hypothetical protein [Candidatus Methylomirabilis sp.]
MKIWRPLGVIVGAVALFLAPSGATAAGKYDGSAPMLCVPVLMSECRLEGECRRVTAESVNLPQFMKVDVKAQKVYSEEAGRASPVTAVEHVNGNVVLEGAQAGRGWTMTISEETGKMSLAISSSEEGWVGFGHCTLLP